MIFYRADKLSAVADRRIQWTVDVPANVTGSAGATMARAKYEAVSAGDNRDNLTLLPTPMSACEANPKFADAIKKTLNEIQIATRYEYVAAMNHPIDVIALDKAFRTANVSLEKRCRLKNTLYFAGLIPA